MKIAHNIKLSVFAYEHEEDQKVKDSLVYLCPFNLQEEKIAIKHSTAKGFQERKIQIFEINLKKHKHTNIFLTNLKKSLSQSQLSLLLRQADSRLDSDLNFFIRLDKPTLIKDKVYKITDSGDCFHIKISIAAYPANKDAGLNVVKDWLSPKQG